MLNSFSVSSPKRDRSDPNPSAEAAYEAGYQQALADFAVAGLLQRLQSFSDAHFDAAWAGLRGQEAEAIAANLIQSLTANLSGALVAAYLDAMRCSLPDMFQPLVGLQLPPPSTALPGAFPEVEVPRFLYGDRLFWRSEGEVTDWGMAIGFEALPGWCV